MFQVSVPTVRGVFVAYGTRRGLCRLVFPGTDARDSHHPIADADFLHSWADMLHHALEAYFDGHRRAWDEISAKIPLDWDAHAGRVFDRRVWRVLGEIPWGQTLRYGEVALSAGYPGAARAVGGACRRNPYPLLIPCHRVVGASDLGGFSAGLEWKAFLLDHECRGDNRRPAGL